MSAARKQKALDRLYNFDGRVMTLGDYLNSITVTNKTVTIKTHTTHRVNLEYKEIKPKSIYTIWYYKNGNEVGLDVPKLIYDDIEPKPDYAPVDTGEELPQLSFAPAPDQQLRLF